jgi:hypothetical protein
VPVDGGLARRAVGHRRDWDPTGSLPPGAGAPDIRRRHVPHLVQEVRLPLVEVAAAETVRLVAGLHLSGVGELRRGGDEEERRENVVRRGFPAMAPGRGFYRPGERRACMRDAHLRRPVFRSDGSLRRCAKLPSVQLFGARGEETGEWRRRSVGRATDSGPRSEPRAQLASPVASPMDMVWIGCAG